MPRVRNSARLSRACAVAVLEAAPANEAYARNLPTGRRASAPFN